MGTRIIFPSLEGLSPRPADLPMAFLNGSEEDLSQGSMTMVWESGVVTVPSSLSFIFVRKTLRLQGQNGGVGSSGADGFKVFQHVFNGFLHLDSVFF